mmetsp:Transcript_32102/g.75024  ORF Transcript_32102/g.75024 Transcript_32102/m.75024 type:complete len:483 (+) Transcript_32102:100-1548(+)
MADHLSPDIFITCLAGEKGNVGRIVDIVRTAEHAICNLHELRLIYSSAMDVYPKVEDGGYRELCVKYMQVLCELDTNEAREFHNRQRAFGITSDARMYEARARLEEREGDTAKALKILQEGLRIGAGPPDRLTAQIAALHMRRSKHCDSEIQQILEPLEAQTEVHDTTMEIEAESVPPIRRVHERPLMKMRSWAEGSTQTEVAVDTGKPGNPSADRCLQRWLRVECRRYLLNSFGAWKRLVDTSAQMRREALFDALRGQLDSAQRRCRAAELCLAKGQAEAGAICLRAGLRAWRSLAKLCRQRAKLADAAYQEFVRRSASLILWAWRTCLSSTRVEDFENPEQPENTALDCLLVDSCPNLEEDMTEEPCHQTDLCEKPAAGKPSGVAGFASFERQPLASVAIQNARYTLADAEDAKRMRGPERFFYDTSSYTGCARYGGPMIVDKKENTSGPTKTGTSGKVAQCSGSLGQFQTKRSKPFLPR